jgi:hypothetical protein
MIDRRLVKAASRRRSSWREAASASQRVDHTGQRFGRLVVVEFHSMNPTRWLCRCDCGEKAVVPSKNLRKGRTRSCGCLRREVASRSSNLDARTTHGMSGTPTYVSWQSMIQRCTNPGCPSWCYYGEIGVTVCDRWRTFAGFLEDMGERPAGTSLDRYPDPTGDYVPSNCRWATPTEQVRNRRAAA